MASCSRFLCRFLTVVFLGPLTEGRRKEGGGSEERRDGRRGGGGRGLFVLL
jgi:hypothetical protein